MKIIAKKDLFINDEIRVREVRLVGLDGEQLGIKPLSEAQAIADDANVDLVLIQPQATPPVAKIMDYGKFKFEYQKKQKEQRKKQSVVTVKEVRLSPVIDKGEADVIISFEQLEAARWVEFLKKDGVIITNTQKMEPMPVITGAAEYPEGLIEKLTAAGAKVDAKDFLALAEEAGSSKAVNIALMGRFSTYFPDITDEQWQDAIEKNVPAKFLELNRKAFELGRNA